MLGFHQVVGNEGIIKHLQNAVQSQKVSHAYILHGEEGMGKKLLASALSKTLQCEEGGLLPCHKCKSCMQADSGNHPDILWIKHEKTSIGVDDIRIQLNSDIQIRPYQSSYKIYIIDLAEKMTEAAQNALLKTLEEPPEYAVIILLVSNVNAMLTTVLSRCMLLQLKPIDKNLIKNYLMVKHEIPDYMAETAANFSGGNIGKAIKYASSEEFLKMKDDIYHILKHVDDMEVHEVITGIKSIASNKSSIEDYIELIILWYRDVIIYKATNDLNYLLNKDEFQYIKRHAETRNYENLDNIINAMETAKHRLKANVNSDITIELMLLTIKENSDG